MLDGSERRRGLDGGETGSIPNCLDSLIAQVRHPQLRDSGVGEKASIAKLFEQVGLQRILSLLEAEDADVRIHAVKVVANLAAEETNQEKIVEAGGLTSLLMLLRSSEDETIHRVAAGAIANLAMNETNQELIMAQGGISLLSITAAHAEDPQTLRMIAGALANLCGNVERSVLPSPTSPAFSSFAGSVAPWNPSSLSISFLWLNVDKILAQFGQQHEITIVYLFLPNLLVASFQCPLKAYLSSQNITVPIMFSSALAIALHIPATILLCRAKARGGCGRKVDGGPRSWRLDQVAQAFGAVLPDHLPRVVLHRDLDLANRAAHPHQTGGGSACHRAQLRLLALLRHAFASHVCIHLSLERARCKPARHCSPISVHVFGRERSFRLHWLFHHGSSQGDLGTVVYPRRSDFKRREKDDDANGRGGNGEFSGGCFVGIQGPFQAKQLACRVLPRDVCLLRSAARVCCED
ncbi:armadillo repeat kinesin 3 [Actinidia rufa]|uniref:Vacuolar protein 8 n=1 Tax=Actinidia rufa TaxID=165716 RepID=A0A7J0FR91_9ERIC|nr:armadillo repeat kinesin 3 [Actinidia rufa]